jgi:hypothetical protein
MKKNCLSILLVCALGTVQAQYDDKVVEIKNAVKVNPLSILLGTANVAYERALNEKQSIQLGAYYTGISILGTKFRGFGITPEYRFYFKKEAIKGVYAAPYLRFQNLDVSSNVDDIEDKATLTTYGGGGLIGKQWLFNKFTMEAYGGLGYNAGKLTLSSGAFEDSFEGINRFDGVSLTIGFRIGFGF